MAVENVVCPKCGREALATVPMGQRLISVNDAISGAGPEAHGADYYSRSKCTHCKSSFYVFTADLKR